MAQISKPPNAHSLTHSLQAGILALVHGEISFAQSVMVGSILSDILLVSSAIIKNLVVVILSD